MNGKRDLRNIGKTYEEMLANNMDDLWILFIKYYYSNKMNNKYEDYRVPLIKLLPMRNLPKKWVHVLQQLKPEKYKMQGHDAHIKSYVGALAADATVRHAHISDLQTLQQLLQEAFGEDVQQEDEFLDTLKPATQRHLGDIVDGWQ